MELFKRKPILRKEYQDKDGVYWLKEAKPDWMVFRTQPSSHTFPGDSGPAPTIDLILIGAAYLETPTNIYGLKITKPRDATAKTLARRFNQVDSETDLVERVYAIESEGFRYNIVTGNLWIHIHKGRISESPLDFLYDGDLEKYNYYLETFVEQWIKID